MDWSGRCSTPAGDSGRRETPQAKPRRLPHRPAESDHLKRKGTGTFKRTQPIFRLALQVKTLMSNLKKVLTYKMLPLWIEVEGDRLLRAIAVDGRPHRRSRGGSRTAPRKARSPETQRNSELYQQPTFST